MNNILLDRLITYKSVFRYIALLALMLVVTTSSAQISIDSFSSLSTDVLPNITNSTTENTIQIVEKDNQFVAGWFFIVNIVLVLFFLLKFVMFKEYSYKSWFAWVNQNLFFQFIREKEPINAIQFSIEFICRIYIVTMLTILIIYMIIGQWQLNLQIFLQIYLSFFLFFSLKRLLVYCLATLSDKQEEVTAVSLADIVFMSNLGWFLIPIIFILVYVAPQFRIWMAYTLFGMVLIALFVYIFRLFSVLRKVRLPLNFHFFVYLCAFEIVPYLILSKLLYNFKLSY